jgi:hypothetical protein
MKSTLTLLFFFIARLCTANMASPIREGTLSSSAFSSRDIDILKEKIHITLGKDFKTASFVIEYFIRSDIEGVQIPLLFHAQDYVGDFKVWVNNQEVPVLDGHTGSLFEKFSDSFDSSDGESETVTIYWEKESGFIYPVSDLKYFDADLPKGESMIRVEYTASAWSDISKWVKEYSIRYSLSPAKHWRSFGSLEIIVDGSAFSSQLTATIGQPTRGKLDSVAVWDFDSLPADFFEIIYTPEINAYSKFLIAIGPKGLTLFLALVIAVLHYWVVKKFRRSKPARKYSWVVMAGSIINPLIILIGFTLSFGLIDMAIGAAAGGYHGYTVMVILLYPILMPVYWLGMWVADKRIKSKIMSSAHSP